MPEATLDSIVNFAAADTSRITGTIAASLAQNSPFMNVLEGGTFPSNVSKEQRSVVQEDAAPADSLAIPSFTDSDEFCDDGELDTEEVGSVEFTYKLESKQGRGPRVCVTEGRNSFKGAYMMAENSLRQLLTKYINADIRAQLMLRSGTKVVANDTLTFDQMINGGSPNSISVDFPNVAPNAPLTMTFLKKLVNFLHEDLLADMDGSGIDAHFKFIGSRATTDSLRDELNVREDARALVTGRYKLGEQTIVGYAFEGPYRGVALGNDQLPLRASAFAADPEAMAWVNPYASAATTNGTAGRITAAYRSADIEVSYLIAKGSFKRLVPERYTGEGSFKFNEQLVPGQLEWFYKRDNTRNLFGKYGFHIYEIERAYRPIRPYHIIPIVHKKCTESTGLTACSNLSNSF